MSVASKLTESFTRMPEYLAEIAANDPIAAVLLAGGSLLIAVCIGVAGFFGGGALLELLNPTGS